MLLSVVLQTDNIIFPLLRFFEKLLHAIPSGGDCRSTSLLDLRSSCRSDGRPAKAFSRPFNLFKEAKVLLFNLLSEEWMNT